MSQAASPTVAPPSSRPRPRAWRNWRVWLAALAILLTLFLGGLLYLYYGILKDPQRSAALVTEQLQKFFQKVDIEIDQVHVYPFEGKAVIERLRIKETEQTVTAPGQGRFLDVKRVVVTFAQGSFTEIAEIRVEQPTVTIARDADKKWNFKRLLAPFDKARGTGKGEEGAPAKVPVVHIVEGRLVYEDPNLLMPGRNASLRPIELRVDSPPGTSRIEFHGTFSGQAFGMTKLSGHLDADGTVAVNVEPIDEIKLTGEHPLIEQAKPEFKDKLTALGARAGRLLGNIRIRGNHEKDEWAVSLDLGLDGVTLAPADLPWPITAASGRLVYRDGKWRTPTPVRARLAGVPLIARAVGGGLRITPDTPGRFVQLRPALVRELERVTGLPLHRELGLRGAVALQIDLPLPGAGDVASVKLEDGWLACTLLDDRLDRITGRLSVSRAGKLTLEQLSGEYRGQALQAHGWIDHPGEPRQTLALAIDVPWLALERLSPPPVADLPAYWQRARPSGRIRLAARWAQLRGGPVEALHRLELADVAVSHRKLRVSGISGRLLADERRLYAGQVTAKLPAGRLVARDVSLPLDGAGPLAASITLDRVGLTSELIDLLPEKTGKQLTELALRGEISGTLSVLRDAADKLTFGGNLTPKGVTMRYRELPLRVTGGSLELASDRVTARRVTLTAGSSRLRADGWIQTAAKPEGDLTLTFSPLTLDTSLVPLIPQSERVLFVDVYPDARLAGRLRLQLRGEKSPRLTGKLRVLGGTVRPRDFPMVFRDVRGEILLAGGKIQLRDITGRHGRIRAIVTGYFDTGESRAELDIRGIRVPFDQTIRQALEPQFRTIFDEYSPSGTADIHLALFKVPGKPMLPRFLRLMPRGDATMRFFEFPYPVREVRGTLVFTKKQVLFSRLRGKAGPAPIEINGIIGVGKPHDLLDISIQARGALLDEKLARVLPPQAQRLHAALQPRGSFTLHCRLLRLDPQDPQVHPIIQFVPTRMSVRLKQFDYPLLLTGGRVEVTRNLVQFRKLQASHGTSRIVLDGKIRSVTDHQRLPLAVGLPLASAGMTAPSFVNNRLDLEITSPSFAVDADLLKALAPYVGDKPVKYGLVGKFRKLHVKLEGYLADSLQLDYKLSGQLVDSQLEPGVEIDRLGLDFSGAGTITSRSHTGRGKIRRGSLSLVGVRATDVGLDWSIVGRYLTIKKLTGKLYDGTLVGSMVADLSPSGAFRAGFRVEKVDLAKLGKEVLPGKQLAGSFTAGIELEGLGGDTARLVGRGGAYVKDGHIWKLPLFLGITEAFDLKEPAAFRTGALEFTIRNRKLYFERVAFKSAPLWLRGRGTLDFGGNLDVTLTTWFAPETIPRIPIVDRLWRKVKRNVIPVKVTGPVLEPDVSLRPFDFVQGKSPR